MTTARRAISCPECGFATDHTYHLLNCVPPSQWPRDFRDRKGAALHHGTDDIMEIDGQRFNAGPIPVAVVEREPEPEKPRGLAEYRRLHPEANPLTAEQMTVREFRQREDGGQDEWDRVVGVREAVNQAQTCPRCHRPMLDRSMHITCQPVDGEAPAPDEARNRLKRDDVEMHPRHPVVHTQADVRTGNGWYAALPSADEPPPDEDEMRDFIGEVDDLSALDTMTPEEAADEYTLTYDAVGLAERLAAEQAAWVPESTADGDPAVEPFTCEWCGKVSASKTGHASHLRAEARKREA